MGWGNYADHNPPLKTKENTKIPNALYMVAQLISIRGQVF